MYLLHVAPITRGVLLDALSYLSPNRLEPGTLVRAPLRGKTVPALILEVRPAREARQEVKKVGYRLRKIEAPRGAHLFLEPFVEAAQELAVYYASSQGSVLSLLAPKEILRNADRAGQPEGHRPAAKKDAVSDAQGSPLWSGPLILQGADDERLSYYKRRIREEFAKGSSVFLMLPTITDILHMVETFERGIQKYTHVLHGDLAAKKLLETWRAALAMKHPVLIIGTPQFLSLPREDVSTVIVDRENSPAYKTPSRPFVDMRHAAEIYARVSHKNLIVGDAVLRSETIFKKETGDADPLSHVTYRILSRAESTLVDMAEYKGERPFRILSQELLHAAKKSTEQNQHLFLFVTRKGLAPSTVCGDCGKTLTCPTCSAPLVLYEKNPEDRRTRHAIETQTFYLCHHCSFVTGSDITCPHCDGWKLETFGIGVERVVEELKTHFPKYKLFKLDSSVAKTYKQASAVMHSFLGTPGAILVGTEMAPLYFENQIENVGVVSIDSFLTLPDYRARERALSILCRLKILASRTFAVQSRYSAWPIFQAVLKGNILNFYRDEIAERKELKYPPFTTLIKITIMERDEKKARAAARELEEELREWKPVTYPAFRTRVRGRTPFVVLVRLKKGAWPDEGLAEILRNLNPNLLVTVDPAELF